MLESLRGLRKFYRRFLPFVTNASDYSRAKKPSSENIFFFAAFAPLREIFLFLVAALPR
jgi:hypothetical protein